MACLFRGFLPYLLELVYIILVQVLLEDQGYDITGRGLPGGASGKYAPADAGDMTRV